MLREHFPLLFALYLISVAPHEAESESPHILWNLKVRCRVHKSLSLIPILSHVHPVHNIPPKTGKEKLSLCLAKYHGMKNILYLTKHHAMKTYGEMEV